MMPMIVTRDPDDRIIPGRWQAPLTEGVELPLLSRLWAGFFEHVVAKFGPPGRQ